MESHRFACVISQIVVCNKPDAFKEFKANVVGVTFRPASNNMTDFVPSAQMNVHFRLNWQVCKYVKTTPPVSKPKPTIPKPKTTKPANACRKSCQKFSCDYWGSEEAYTCSQLEAEYGCDCSGCDCKIDKQLLCANEKTLCNGKVELFHDGQHVSKTCAFSAELL